MILKDRILLLDYIDCMFYCMYVFVANVFNVHTFSQLGQQVEGWAERVSELEEEMSRCKVTHSMMQQDVSNKDECIMVMN